MSSQKDSPERAALRRSALLKMDKMNPFDRQRLMELDRLLASRAGTGPHGD